MNQVCIHGHFYQPTREDPWTGLWDAQPSAAPYRDWNTRITAECYAPNAAARLLGPKGGTRRVVNTYASMSFDIGPTLIAWLEVHAPPVLSAMVDADRRGAERYGRGPAIAQPYHHAILPLCDPDDRRQEIRRGLEAFERVFGRCSEGLWLPETAVDTATLEAVAAEGVSFVILAPHQVDAPTGQAYRVVLPSGRTMCVVPYGKEISAGVAFGGWLDDGGDFARRLCDAADRDGLALVATDGESYGHHHPFGEMALAYAAEQLGERLTNLPSWLAKHPPTVDAKLIEPTSWSCSHGIERWRSACGCASGDSADLRWRAPLRAALDRLRARAVPHADAEAGRHLLAMFTSCAWFFDQATGIEPLQNLRHAACAIGQIRRQTGIDLSEGFLVDIAAIPGGSPGLVDHVRAHLSPPPLPAPAAAARRMGVLMPVSALGDLDGAVAFIDWLAEAGVSLWQVLPLGPTDLHGSPYSSGSALSGNPDLTGTPVGVVEGEAPWADQAALFAALKAEQGGAPWWAWPDPLRDGEPAAVSAAKNRLKGSISSVRTALLEFEAKWAYVRRYACARGVTLVGDVPIYVARDSVDVWANRRLFLEEQVSGAPPDAFAETGQWWGTPVYDWDAMAADGFRWWRERIRRGLAHCDVLRLDHFIGFSRYWSIPASAEDARGGQWRPGPGRALFDALGADLGSLPLIVEDLGEVDENTRQLRDSLGLPGMAVLQFDMPQTECMVVYPGTHDNDTVRGWLGDVADGAVWEVIDTALASPARWAVIQVQDLLTLGSEARMNTPGTVGDHNWSWRLPVGALTPELAARVRARLVRFDRLRPQPHLGVQHAS
jgi:4-alpha-glucanotransferase